VNPSPDTQQATRKQPSGPHANTQELKQRYIDSAGFQDQQRAQGKMAPLEHRPAKTRNNAQAFAGDPAQKPSTT